jgi:phosphate transport system permease protein
MIQIAIFLVIGLGLLGFAVGRARAAAFSKGRIAAAVRPHSRPNHHGAYVLLWAVGPALLIALVAAAVIPALVDEAVISALPAAQQPATAMDRDALLSEVRAIASGESMGGFIEASQSLVPVYTAASSRFGGIAMALAVLVAIIGALFGFSRVRPDFRARTQVEKLTMVVLLLASLIAILTTIGIVASLLFESIRFFGMVSPVEFLFGTEWSPQTAMRADQVGSSGSFGAIPLFWGTIFIGAIIAMIVAIPFGLMSAIYLTQYASPRLRTWMKPTLELLAGVPTVVYGYFAALVIAPPMRDFAVSIGIANASSESALAAGLVMGVMIIPFVSSMADDSIAAVPQAMRDGSLAMGATPSETIKRVLIPAALPGIVGGVLLAVSRAIGETMIVVMAAGLAANLTANPFASVTTVTTQIVQLLTGDTEFDSPKTLAAFALGLVLFLITLALNIIALRVVKKYREAYD